MNADTAPNWPVKPEAPIEPLSYRLAEAAAAIGVSERTLWSWAKTGDVPCVRIGKCLLFPVRELQDWLSAKTQKGVSGEHR